VVWRCFDLAAGKVGGAELAVWVAARLA